MSQPDRALHLAPIHPFTRAQGRVLECLANGNSQKEAAIALGIAEKTVNNHLYGTDHTDHLHKPTKSEAGLFGVMERITGVRPCSETALVTYLVDDVLFFDQEPTGHTQV